MTLKTDYPLNGGNSKSIEVVVAQLKKEFGEVIQRGKLDKVVDAVSTGSLALDVATGIGGYPRGRITQIAGWESAGKTTHALKAVANIQKRGGRAVFIDTEYALDPRWATKLGVDMDALEWLQIDDLETAHEAAADLADSAAVDMIIFDSVAGAPIRAVVEGDLGDSNMGKRAKIMSDAMAKLNGPVARNNVWMLFTNQLRDSLDPYKPAPVRPGGHALGFHSSMIIDIRGKKEKNSKGAPSYLDIRAITEKNKLAPPGRIAEYRMFFDGEIDVVDELATILTTQEHMETLGITRKGAWYYFPQDFFPEEEEPKLNGKGALAEALTEAPVYTRLREKVLEALLS